MDIRSSLEGLKSLLGTQAAAPAAVQSSKSAAAAASTSALGSDLATLSSAGSEVSQTASGSGVRMDKVAEIQAALSTGSYNVSASAVASKVVDAMMGSQS